MYLKESAFDSEAFIDERYVCDILFFFEKGWGEEIFWMKQCTGRAVIL